MIGMSAGTIRNLWSAIEDCHRQFGYTTLLAMRTRDFARYSRTVAFMKGLSSRLIFPIGVHHVKQMLELTAISPAQTRDVLMCVLGTVMRMRVNEVDQLKICDVLWRFDGGFHPHLSNTLACRVYKRKQDQARKGLYPPAGKAVFTCLLAYTEDAGLEVAEDCTKGRSPDHQRCAQRATDDRCRH